MIQPASLSREFVDANCARLDRSSRKVRQDHRDVSRARHDGVGLVRRRLAAAAGMDMDVRDNAIAAFPTECPKARERRLPDRYLAGFKRALVDIVIIDEIENAAAAIGKRDPEQIGTAFASLAVGASGKLGNAIMPETV